jgi:hypothetical protein
MRLSTSYTDLAHLKTADAWDLITQTPLLDGLCRFWQSNAFNPRYADPMKRRQAASLVKHTAPRQCKTRLGAVRRAQVQAPMAQAGVGLQVNIMLT